MHFWLRIAQLERLRVKCLAQELGQVQLCWFYVSGQMMSYLLSLHRLIQLVKVFSPEREANVTHQLKQWQYQQMDRRVLSPFWHSVIWCTDRREKEEVGGGPVRPKSTSSLLDPRQWHQSSFPQSYSRKFLVSVSFALPDRIKLGFHFGDFIYHPASLYNNQLSQHRTLMNQDSLYSMDSFFLFEFKSSSQVAAGSIFQRGLVPSLIGSISFP